MEEKEIKKPVSVKKNYSLPRISLKSLFKFLFIIIVSAVAGYSAGHIKNNTANSTNSITKSQQQIISSESQLFNQLAKTVSPSVVSIDVTSEDSFQSFYGGSQQSAGTGLIISADGIIMTNRHVVTAGTTLVSVTLSDGTQLSDVSVIGRTSENDSLDVAFLKINDKKGKTLVPAKLADSSKVQIGDKVVAIGNALGQFQNTITSGIISGYGRSVVAGDGQGIGGSTESLQNLFQTDAAINQGNSGGPLVNINSEVIGLNTAIAGNAQNIGFAIPVNDLQGLIKSVLKKGKLERPYLGVRYISLTDDIAYQLNLDIKRGAYILPATRGQIPIIPDSPADKAGLKEKDIITKINNQAIDQNHSLTSLLSQHSVGDKVKLTINRDTKTITVDVTLDPAPAN